jgi:signal transduction histidine kinase
MIAHEANNLLTPILSYADYALNADDPQLMKKALSVTSKNVRILVGMSERLLAISAAAPPKRGPVHVRATAEDALAALCRDLSKDGITLTVDVPESLTVYADALQLQQVLFNLLLNAREAMAPQHGGRLTISASPVGNNQVAIRVHNSGPPIPAELLPHVFDALQTSKPPERNGRRRCGGLGLALCRDLVEENGGAIAAESSPEQGTTFTIALSTQSS